MSGQVFGMVFAILDAKLSNAFAMVAVSLRSMAGRVATLSLRSQLYLPYASTTWAASLLTPRVPFPKKGSIWS